MDSKPQSADTRSESDRHFQWVDDHADHVFNYVAARVNDTETAKDLVQDTFLAALKSKDKLREQSSIRTWLFAITRNKLIDHYRRQTTSAAFRQPLNEESVTDSFFETEGIKRGRWLQGSAPTDWNVDLSTVAERNQFRTILSQCVDKLPENGRAVFSMKYLDDLSSKEICKELDITPSNYWVLIHRAKLQLRKCMEVNWFEKNNDNA